MTRKVTISLDDDLADEVQRRLVDTGQVASFSAAVSESLATTLATTRRASARLRAALARAEDADPQGYAAAREQAAAARAELRAAADEHHRPAAAS